MNNILRPTAPAQGSFLPQEYVARKTEGRINIIILSLFALVMAGVVGAFFVTNRRWENLKVEQAQVNEQYVQEGKKIEQLKGLESQRAQMMEKAQITAALLERVPRWAVLGEVTLRKPISTTLDSLIIKSTRVDPVIIPAAAAPAPVVKSLTDKLTGAPAPVPEKPRVMPPTFTYALTISGSAATNADVADFFASLQASPVFEKMELTFIREAKEQGKEFRKFEFTGAVRADADTRLLAESLTKLKNDRLSLLEGGKTRPNHGPAGDNTASAAVDTVTTPTPGNPE